ncbi:MAG: outer membrane beta-barrel protein [Acidobacteriaceae bacterium]
MNGSRTGKTSSRRRYGIRRLQATWRRWHVLVLLLACSLSAAAPAQSTPTASRPGDLQFGGGFTFGNSEYNFDKVTLNGGAFYATFDKRSHWGYEVDFRQVKPASDSTVYQRTYEFGPRFYFNYGRFVPYTKVLYGRGVYNFSGNVANIAYNLYTFGGGTDFLLTPGLNLRADYEYQSWQGFPLATLNPSLVTIGVAFHFRK